jgi:hypothetical protein
MAEFPAPARRPDGSFEAEVGLGPLAPGEYLIEITAKTGDEDTQSLVPFRITA